jgi:hypothetical protein
VFYLASTNTLAYSGSASVTKIESFITWTPVDKGVRQVVEKLVDAGEGVPVGATVPGTRRGSRKSTPDGVREDLPRFRSGIRSCRTSGVRRRG